MVSFVWGIAGLQEDHARVSSMLADDEGHNQVLVMLFLKHEDVVFFW